MRLTRRSDYALRVLMWLALRPSSPLATIDEVCAAVGVARGHMLKIVHQLGQLGYLETVRGHGGGMRLAPLAYQTTLGDLIRQLEPTLEPINCSQPPCRLLPACRLRDVFQEAADAFLGVLDRYTLNDLVDQPAPLKQIFGLFSADTLICKDAPPEAQ